MERIDSIIRRAIISAHKVEPYNPRFSSNPTDEQVRHEKVHSVKQIRQNFMEKKNRYPNNEELERTLIRSWNKIEKKRERFVTRRQRAKAKRESAARKQRDSQKQQHTFGEALIGVLFGMAVGNFFSGE